MLKLYVFVCMLVLGQLFAQSPHAKIEQYANRLEAAFDGQKAFETTAYVARFWRLAGNPGYDSAIYRVVSILENAGYQDQHVYPEASLGYRIERHVMAHPGWAPIDARITLAGESQPLMQFSSNRNMLAIRSTSTPNEGIEAEVVWLQDLSAASWQQDMKGKIVFCEASLRHFYKKARQKGAIGALSYDIPDFNQPQKNDTLVPFSALPMRLADGGWGIFLSKKAKDALMEKLLQGENKLQVSVKSAFYDTDELSLIAEVKGESQPEQRFVFSAHVQEPGANDNASGVGCQAEMARVAATLWQSNSVRPARTLTFYWGNEISGIHRYLSEDKERTDDIRWGISLDMVGEDTEKTGGTFLIEKMQDPSAIWTRGEDKHTEWGAGVVGKKDLFPHFLNDFVLNRFLEQGKKWDWVVKTNPFEGGSDHIPFLRARKPAVLLWHFTDQYYHTDGDRIDKVSPLTLSRVGISSLIVALTLCDADDAMASMVLAEVEAAALKRLETEFLLSQQAMKASAYEDEREILQAWADWYKGALQTCEELPSGNGALLLPEKIAASQQRVEQQLETYLRKLR